MIDLHTHTLLSDGVLLPSELIRRAEVIGYEVLGITDHADSSNIDHVLPRIVRVCRDLQPKVAIKLIPGVELTHIPPSDFEDLVKYARKNGARIVVGHGETIVEPVISGTNKAAISAKVDILAHPGLISEDDAAIAASMGVALEITTRSGHCYSNGHVVKTALKTGAKLVLNTDTHSPENLVTTPRARSIALGAGLSESDIENRIFANMRNLADKLLG
ncbi:MAG: histidinol phosphate phosphatase domain-containing protein [Candidatus Omnitrophica bacterium]|nr:histidinol phosphate phosphatase domain-containing protein [Candidatus Omnitrophota bacterium]